MPAMGRLLRSPLSTMDLPQIIYFLHNTLDQFRLGQSPARNEHSILHFVPRRIRRSAGTGIGQGRLSGPLMAFAASRSSNPERPQLAEVILGSSSTTFVMFLS